MFQDHLRHLVENTEGSVASLLMGFDGISVDSYANPLSKFDIQTVGMELSFILSQVRRAAENLEVGRVEELTIKTENLTVLLRGITSDYFIALALTPEGNSGKGRYMMKLLSPKLLPELS